MKKEQTIIYYRICTVKKKSIKGKKQDRIEILDLSYYDDCGRLETEIENRFVSDLDAIEFINHPANKKLKKGKLILDEVMETTTILKQIKL